MKLRTIQLIPFITFLFANASFATSSICINFLEQSDNLSYVLTTEFDEKAKSLSYMERIEQIGEEISRVESEMEMSSRLVDRVLSKATRGEYQKLQDRLNFFNAQIENLKEIEDIVYSFPIVDKAMDVHLTQSLLDSRSLRRRLAYTNQRVRESRSIAEQNFTTAVSHYILYGEEFSFLNMPFSHWFTLNILHGRVAQGHFEYLIDAFQQTDMRARVPNEVERLNDILARALAVLDQNELDTYTSQAVSSGLIVPADQIVKSSTKKSKSSGSPGADSTGSRDYPSDNYHESNDQGPAPGFGIHDSDGGDMGGGGPPP